MGLYRVRPWGNRITRTWDPWRDMEELQHAMEQVAARSAPPVPASETGSFAPDVDLYVSGVVVVVRIDLPGIRPADLSVVIESGVLKIEGLRGTEAASQDGYLCCERPTGRFVRLLPLPAGLDIGLARATLAEGVLEIIVPKGEETGLKRVVVDVDAVTRRAEPLVDAVAL